MRRGGGERGSTTTLTTILPGAVFGPLLAGDNLGSVQVIRRLLRGDMSRIPRIGLEVVDVRDLVDIHLRAMTSPAAADQRFLATGEFMWMADIARALRAHLGTDAARVPTKTVPDVVVRLLARRRPELRGIMPGLGRRNRHSTAKAEAVARVAAASRRRRGRRLRAQPRRAPAGLMAPRRDAARNRELLVQAAREVFATRGLGATLDDVAAAAGVGTGTAYRHFRNKHELAAEVLRGATQQIVIDADDALAIEDPWQALVAFFETTAARQAGDRGPLPGARRPGQRGRQGADLAADRCRGERVVRTGPRRGDRSAPTPRPRTRS